MNKKQSFPETPPQEQGVIREVGDENSNPESTEPSSERIDSLAEVRNKVINSLQEAIAQEGVTREEASAHLRKALDANDEEDSKKYFEIMMQFNDLNVLQTGSPYPDFELTNECSFRYNLDPMHSKKTGSLFIEHADLQDVQTIIFILQEFSEVHKLLERMSIDTIRAVLSDQSLHNNSEIHLKATEKIAQYLLQSGRHADFLTLCDEGLLSSLKAAPYEIESNEFLYQLAKRSKRGTDPMFIDPLLYISDTSILSKILNDKAEDFSFENESYRKEFLEFVELLLSALERSPEVIEAGPLENKNKFIVLLSTNNKERAKYYIAWAGLKSGGAEHKMIRNKLESKYGDDVKQAQIQGGFITIEKQDGESVATIHGCSGDFGFYSKNIVERFQPDIERALRESLGTEVEVRVELSSR